MTEFSSHDEHRRWLASQAALPRGFRAGSAGFEFTPPESGKPARMTVTVIAADQPTESFGALFTRNAFPGAPVLVGRQRLSEPRLGAIVVNNKISNVCAPGGVETVERTCRRMGELLGFSPNEVLAASTGVIGWKLPVDEILSALPRAVATLQADSILPAAEGIVTTDLYPKVRRAEVGGGSIVGIAKGAGMMEPNLATMLVYLLTDVDVSRDRLRAALRDAVDHSFNCMSIDSDTSTSDAVVLLSSRKLAHPAGPAFEDGLARVCADLAHDVARNGEGVHHVIRVRVTGAPNTTLARGVGKAIVNSPLVQCAVAGNDPNVGRLVMAIGKFLGSVAPALDVADVRISVGGHGVFDQGEFRLDPGTDAALVAHLRAAEMYASAAPPDGLTFRPPIDYPPHERCVEVEVDLGRGAATATTLGTDRTHEYITENADYRS